jgi:RNA 2',3'-cyclic 3'-phosphodiesterase
MPQAAGTERVFLALELDAAGRAELIAWQQAHLRQKRMRLVPPAQLHLTLWFFGELGAPAIEALLPALEAVPKPPALPTRIMGFGGFPSARHATILVAKVLDSEGEVNRLHGACSATIVGLGHAAERRPFVPHITVARLAKADDVAPYLRDPSSLAPFRLDRLTLMRSTLTERGAQYSPIASWALGTD